MMLLHGTCGLVPLRGQEQKSSRTDQYGHALPEGAIARLGTLRFVHLGGISSVAISPDAKVVASGVRTGKAYEREKIVDQTGRLTITMGRRTQATIRLWNSENGKLIREIDTPDAPVSAIQFAPTGSSLFAGCGRFLCRWDASTGKKLWEQEAITAGRFDRGGEAEKILLAKDKVISLHSGTIVCSVSTIGGGASFYYHPQKAIRFWDSKTGAPLALPKTLESTIHPEARIATLFHDIAVAPDATFAAVTVSQADPLPRGTPAFEDKWKYTNRRLEIIDLVNGNTIHVIPDENGMIRCLTFVEDGHTLAFVADNEIRLIHARNGQKRLLADIMESRVLRLKFVNKQQLAALLENSSIRIWNVDTGERLHNHVDRELFLDAARGGRIVATIHGNTVRIVETDTGKAVPTFDGHRLTPLVRYALLAKNTLLSADAQKAHWWDARSWQTKESLGIPGSIPRYWGFRDRSGRMDQAVSVEKQLYVKEIEKGIEVRDIKTDKLVWPLQLSGSSAYESYFSASGNRLATHQGKNFHLIDVATGKRLSEVPKSERMWLGFNCPALLSPQGRIFAMNESHQQIDLFEVESGKTLRVLQPQFSDKSKGKGSILGIWFSADEQVILGEIHEQIDFQKGFSEEKVGVALWDVKTGEMIQEIVIWPVVNVFWRESLSEAQIHTLTLSNDHRLVALAEKDGKTVEIWETASGSKRGELVGHEGPIADLAFSADNRRLASSSEDTTILIWDMNRPLQTRKFKNRLEEKELAAHWTTLFQPDAAKADSAIWSLVYAPKDSLPFLRIQLKSVAHPDQERVRGLLEAIDNDDFQVRSKAESQLESLGELVLADLHSALKQKISLERQRRLERLLRKAKTAALPFGTSKRVAQWRALEVLEKIGSPAAKLLVRELADGAVGAQLTRAAKATLTRMEQSRQQD
ncbi:MAG: WD40 repeat domain-containing protein [Gemmataceae bacterium]|nr:WD40 repeat domain-containing protein [Gemmataceae bacterium]